MHKDDDLNNIISSENSDKLNYFIKKKSNQIKDLVAIKPKDMHVTSLRNVTLYIQKSNIHEYGVFTKEKILINDTIEICYIIELDFRDKYHKDKKILDYAYTVMDINDKESSNHGNKLLLLTGNGMLYNHSTSNNAEWKMLTKDRKAILIATKNIEPNNEITINYGPGYWQRQHNVKN